MPLFYEAETAPVLLTKKRKESRPGLFSTITTNLLWRLNKQTRALAYLLSYYNIYVSLVANKFGEPLAEVALDYRHSTVGAVRRHCDDWSWSWTRPGGAMRTENSSKLMIISEGKNLDVFSVFRPSLYVAIV